MKEPDKWCIKITPENREVIEKWRTANVTLNGYGYCVNETSFNSNIGYWYPDKPNEYTEISFEEFKVYTNKPLKQAVHCKTQEEWDFACDKDGKIKCVKIQFGEEYNTFNYTSSFSGWSTKEYYIKNNYQILSFQEWCDLNGYKMEKSKQEILKEFAEKYPPGTKVKSPDGVEFIISTTYKYEGKNNDFLQSSPYYTGLLGEVLAIKGNTCVGEYLYKDGKYAEIIKDAPKFEVGKWYSIKTAYNWIIKFKEIKDGNIRADWNCLNERGKKVEKGGCWESEPTEIKELSIKEIQQYLPEEHPDKIKSNQEFKVGDYIILENAGGWNYSSCNNGCLGLITKMSNYKPSIVDKYICSITGDILNSKNKDTKFNDVPVAFYEGKWIVRHATSEEINSHLISIGQIPVGEPLNTGIEPNKDNSYSCISGNRRKNPQCTFYSIKINGQEILKPKMILSIDDEELPMVNIIKTNTIKQLLNSE